MGMTLRERLAGDEFVVTGELGPPAGPDAAAVRDTARALAPVVHAANVTDNPAATVKMAALAAATFVLDEGLEPILQLTGRDRNLLALQADLLGAWALGVRTVLALSGDPLEAGGYDGVAREVRDVDSLGLARVVSGLNAGTLHGGEPLSSPTDFLIGAAVNPLVDDLARLEAKVATGVGFLQTNIVYDVERFAAWLEPMVAAGVTGRAPLLVGVAPPRSSAMLRFLDDHVRGVDVDHATFARLDGLAGEAAKDEGVRLAAEVIARVRELPGVGGVHLMAPGWEREAIPRVVAAASLAHTA